MQPATNPIQTRARPRLPPPSGDTLCTRCFMLDDPLGFHARPAALFAATAQRYDADIIVSAKGRPFVSGKSVMALLTLEIQCGDVLSVAASGRDGMQAMAAIEELIASRFGQATPDAGPAPGLAATVAPRMSRPECAYLYAHAPGGAPALYGGAMMAGETRRKR